MVSQFTAVISFVQVEQAFICEKKPAIWEMAGAG
jgi:hypothetical protein